MDERLDPVRLSMTSLADLVVARRRGLEMALALGFPLPDATQIATAISEFSRQVIFQGQGGMLTLIGQIAGPKGIKIVTQDYGPGIPEVESVLAGLRPPPPQLRPEVLEVGQWMDEFDIHSTTGGTTIRATRWFV